MTNHGLLSWHRAAVGGGRTVAARMSGGHAHPEHPLSRRAFIALGGAGVGTVLATDAVRAEDEGTVSDVTFDGGVEACSPAAIPVPGDPALGGLHLWLPVPGVEPSSIFHFRGQVAVAEIAGTGTLTNTNTGRQSRQAFLADMRFMTGAYIGVDGKIHNGTFGFV